MNDVYCEFVEMLTGNDPEKLDQFALRQNKREAGRQIYCLRERLGKSTSEFAEMLGIKDADEIEDLELGNFEESPLDKLRQIYGVVRNKKDAMFPVTVGEISKPEATSVSSKECSRLFQPTTAAVMACKTNKTQDT